MRGAVIDEQRRRVAEARIDAWLWLKLSSERYNLPLDSFGAENVREYLFNCTNSRRVHELLEVESRRRILPIDQLQWIKDDERQIDWLLSYVSKKFGVNFYPSPPTLIGKDLLLAKIDIYEIDLDYKSGAIDKMRVDWNEYLKSDIIFKWFKDKEEAARCAFAWDWLVEHKARGTYGQNPINSYSELLRFYDWIDVNDAQKKLDVASIKRKWSQQKYRSGLKGKSQFNFVLSDQTIVDLDKLASRYETTRPQIIEALIKMEAAQGIYLPQKVKKTPWD